MRARAAGGRRVRCGELKKGPEVLGSIPGAAEEKKREVVDLSSFFVAGPGIEPGTS